MVEMRTGSSIHRLLFDCGQGCLDRVALADTRSIEHLFFSHFHIDHVAGFDAFFPVNCDRPEGEVNVWDPPGTIEIMHHRFRGLLWNLIDGRPGTWCVNEVSESELRSARFHSPEAFDIAHREKPQPRPNCLVDSAIYTVECRTLDHGTPSIGYLVRETQRLRVRKVALSESGRSPGAWLSVLTDPSIPDDHRLEVDGTKQTVGGLRDQLVEWIPGESIAVLTDFSLEDSGLEETAAWLDGCGTLICEAQYLEADTHLARRHRHLTSKQAAVLAAKGGVQRLILYHISSRYSRAERQIALDEARTVFRETHWPEEWSTNMLQHGRVDMEKLDGQETL
jgi:ribonuclease Z